MRTKIVGEYWVDDSGSPWFADGDVGEFNHSGYALDHARRLFLSNIGADTDHEGMDNTAFEKAIDELLEEEGLGEEGRDEALKKVDGYDDTLYAACYERGGDIREYAMEQWGWVWVKGMWAGLHSLTQESFSNLCEGLCEAADQEGADIPQEAEFELRTILGTHNFSVEWKDIEAENFEACAIHFPQPEKCAAVEKMDRELQHEHYRNQPVGD